MSDYRPPGWHTQQAPRERPEIRDATQRRRQARKDRETEETEDEQAKEAGSAEGE